MNFLSKILAPAIKAHSLIYSLILLIIVSSLLSVLLYGLFWNKVSEKEYVKNSQLEQHLESAKILVEQEGFYEDYLDGEYHQLINEDSLTIELKPWGAYSVARCRAFNGSVSITRNYLLGNQITNDTTLELIDNKNPLVLVGSSKIEGKVKVPKAGIKYGTIKSNYYKGERLNADNISYSNNSIDPIRNNVSYWSKENLVQDELDSIKKTNSFSEAPRLYNFSTVKTIASIIKGYSIIESSVGIIISKEASLFNTVIKAPYIKIKSGFKGKIHIVADSIVIESNVTLLFPSSIVCSSKNQGLITIQENSKFGGSIITLGQDDKKSPIVKINEGSSIFGEIICNGYLDLDGEVNGNVITNAFLHTERGGTYINYLVDGSITRLQITTNTFSGNTLLSPKRLEYIETLP